MKYASLESMEKYQKDFVAWAKVAEGVELRKCRDDVKPGAVYWCNLGVGIGSEMLGKGNKFMRPVLVLAKIDTRLLLVLPITSREKLGPHYTEVYLNGVPESLVLYQIFTIDSRRITDFIDEVPPDAFREVKRNFLKLLKRELHKENSPDRSQD